MWGGGWLCGGRWGWGRGLNGEGGVDLVSIISDSKVLIIEACLLGKEIRYVSIWRWKGVGFQIDLGVILT